MVNVEHRGLLFMIGVFVPLAEMGADTRALAYLSPFTQVQDPMKHSVLGQGFLNPWLDLILLPMLLVVFLVSVAWLHHRARVLGY